MTKYQCKILTNIIFHFSTRKNIKVKYKSKSKYKSKNIKVKVKYRM